MSELTPLSPCADQVAELSQAEALTCLEAMSRRVTEIDRLEYKDPPLIEGLPQGVLGGQVALVRRTLLLRVPFYDYGYDPVPYLPADKRNLQIEINNLGKTILDTLTKQEQKEWDYSDLRRGMIRTYKP